MSRPTIPVSVGTADGDIGGTHPAREKIGWCEPRPCLSSESTLDSASLVTLQEPMVSRSR